MAPRGEKRVTVIAAYTLVWYLPRQEMVTAGTCGHMAANPALLNRLKRVEGQVRGITRMVEEERYCIDILTQIQAVRSALTKVEAELLKGHMNHCIESAIVSGNAKEQRKKASELVELLSRAAR